MTALSETLTLERIEENLFRAVSPENPAARIYGGQVIAQALLAGYETVQDRLCHSLHAYFLRPGDPKRPIVYEVDRARDGGSFSNRRVIAVQEGRQIFNLTASFMAAEAGFEHQAKMPPSPPPESLSDDAELLAARAAQPDGAARGYRQQHWEVLQLRSAPPRNPVEIPPVGAEPHQQLWLRAVEPIGDDVKMQQAVLAYASDLALLSTAMMPHGVSWLTPGLQHASLDHAIWFHRASDFNQWHLHDIDSPSAFGARGMNRGAIYAADGRLVASVAQEGVFRWRRPSG